MSQQFRQDDEEDGEDFNMFVSPSRFSGRTPSAATAKSRVFQDIATANVTRPVPVVTASKPTKVLPRQQPKDQNHQKT